MTLVTFRLSKHYCLIEASELLLAVRPDFRMGLLAVHDSIEDGVDFIWLTKADHFGWWHDRWVELPSLAFPPGPGTFGASHNAMLLSIDYRATDKCVAVVLDD